MDDVLVVGDALGDVVAVVDAAVEVVVVVDVGELEVGDELGEDVEVDAEGEGDGVVAPESTSE